MPRVAHYFAAVIPKRDGAVLNRFIKVSTVEHGTSLVAALLAEWHLFRREWVLASSTVDFLRRFVPFPPLQVRVNGKEKIPLDFEGVQARACAARRVLGHLPRKRTDVATGAITTFGFREEGSDVYRPEPDTLHWTCSANLPPR